jgi:ABC-2 type transport system ATP-binding protein
MTVFEPSTLCGGKTYPLVLHAPGFGGTRTTALSSPQPNPSQGVNVGNNISEMVDNGYGVISFDQRGMGDTSGKIRVMDPDFEGKDYLSIMDWAQAKLDWIAYGPTLEGNDPSEPVMGSIGGSYGGMYQVMLANIDKRHRLHAITPNITPSNLSFSLFQGTTPKTLWNTFLFGDGQAAGNGTSRANFDPFVNELFVTDLAADQEDPYAADFFNYHSADYFCNDTAIATNGGAGTMPLLPPTSAPPKVNAMIWIGVRDTLFNYNNGYHNYGCFQKGGGDVRFLSYQAGHNSLGIVPDTGATLYYPSGDTQDSRCGSTLNEDAAQLAWMNQYLKGESGAASIIPTEPCISLAEGDGILVPTITEGENGTEFDLATPITVVSGVQVDVPTAESLYTAQTSTVEAGVPHVQLQVTTTAPVGVGTPIIYVGLGQTHASSSTPNNWDLIDNQVTPLRGVGTFDLDIVGGGTRLQPGDQLGLLIYGLQDQYAATGSVNVASPTVEPITVTGKVWVPFLGPVGSI